MKPSLRPKITSSADVVDVLRIKWKKNRIGFVEEFKVLLLTRSSQLIGIVSISQGGLSGTVVDPKLIFAAALKSGANSLILAHNHPSGNLRPSEADIRLTRKMKEAGLARPGQFLDLPVLDHIILTQESYYSFADEGLL